MKLHCPKCGDLLSLSADGDLQCIRGKMSVKRELERRLRDCYVLETRRPSESIFTYKGQARQIGSCRFCPGCGVDANESRPGDLRCPMCHRSLVEFIHSIIDRHPHYNGNGGWD